MSYRQRRMGSKRAFTMVELLVVIGLVGVLVAILVPALFVAKGQGARAQSMKNMADVGKWMTQYAMEYKQHVLPSRFNYNGALFPGKVRSNPSNEGYVSYQGTWTDILWTLYVEISLPGAVTSGLGHDYTTDSPDTPFYNIDASFRENPLRSTEQNQKGNLRAHPGFFAANQFFNADASTPTFNGWWTVGQIKDPARSMYLIDSFVGETIEDDFGYWGRNSTNLQVDYRYAGDALLLFLDGHVRGEGEIDGNNANDLTILETERKVKVRNLDR